MDPAELRRNQQNLERLAANDLMALWRQVNNFANARRTLERVLPMLVRTYGAAAATLAADWYDQARAGEAVSGRFRAIPADIGDAGTDALAGWAASKGTDLDNVLTLAQGGMQRRIAMASRDTVIGSALSDPRASGWQREGAGACTFCEMLISRGAVYSEASADFASHDHCYCVAVPAFSGKPRPVEPYKLSPRRTIDSETGKPAIDADFKRAKKWVAEHNAG